MSNQPLVRILREMDTLLGEETQTKLFYFPSENGSTLKGKNLLPMGANAFLSEWATFRKGFMSRKANKLQKLSPCKKCTHVYSAPLNTQSQ